MSTALELTLPHGKLRTDSPRFSFQPHRPKNIALQMALHPRQDGVSDPQMYSVLRYLSSGSGSRAYLPCEEGVTPERLRRVSGEWCPHDSSEIMSVSLTGMKAPSFMRLAVTCRKGDPKRWH